MLSTDQITSTGNARIKAIRKLRERKERELSGTYYIEGLRIVAEAVQTRAAIECLIFAPDLLVSAFGKSIVESQADRGTPVIQVSGDVFRSLTSKEGPQGIAAVVRQMWTRLDDLSREDGLNWVALDSAQDPGNVGTILRTHDAVGGAGLILLDYSTDPYDLTCIRASMGAVFSQRLVRTSFEEFSAWKKENGYHLVGACGDASQDFHKTVYPTPLILLMGSERLGLQAHHRNLCDQLVSIPMAGRSDSLNLAVATGIILYEIYNQQRDKNDITE